MDSLVKHISDWLSKKEVCTIFQDTISRFWPISEGEDAKKRDIKIQEWARSNGWKAEIKDMGVRVLLRKLTEPKPDQQPLSKRLAKLPGFANSRALPKRRPAQDANTRAVALVNGATDSEPVKGEDLLPRRLAKQLRVAKKRAGKH
jgi:hypothetical protein